MSPKSDTEGSTKTTSRDKQDIVQTLLSQASAALDLAGNLAPLIPVPFVASIFSSAKVIVDAAAVSCKRLIAFWISCFLVTAANKKK